MATREIVKMGNDILRKKCKPITVFDENLEELLDDMWETMFLNNGMGLAAPQVGILKRIVVMEVNNMRFELINPVISSSEGEEWDKESCLSCGKISEFVKRPLKLTVNAKDRFGNDISITGEKLFARCVCHELDHLDGILFIDKSVKELK